MEPALARSQAGRLRGDRSGLARVEAQVAQGAGIEVEKGAAGFVQPAVLVQPIEEGHGVSSFREDEPYEGVRSARVPRAGKMAAVHRYLPPPVVALAFAAAMALVSRAGEWAPVLRLEGAAWAFAIVGLALFVAAGVPFLQRRTTINPMRPENASRLITDGVYRLTRNPIYLADALLLLAWGLWLADGVALLLVPGFVAFITRFQVKPEERALQARFGRDYSAYCAKVRRWL